MANNKEVKITFKAHNQEFNKSMSEMSKETSSLRQGMKLQQEQMKNNSTESEKLEAKMDGLQKIYDIARQKSEATAKQLEEAKSLWGENSKEAKSYETQLVKNAIAEQQAANAIEDTKKALEKSKQSQSDQVESLRQLDNLFKVTGKSVNDFSDVLGRDLTRAIQDGTATASQLDRAFDQIAKSSLNAGRDLTKLKESIRSLDEGTPIKQVREDLEKVGQTAKDSVKDVDKLGDSLKSLGGAAVSAVSAVTVMSEALSSSSLDTSINISFNVPEESKASVREAVKQVGVYGTDAEAALEGVRRQWALNADATDEMNSEVVKGAAIIARSYAGIDFTELIQETNEVSDALGISTIEATNLINRLLKIGFPPEQLDIIAEYGLQLKRAGYEAEEIETIMANAALSKSWNIDNLLDGLKEGRVRAVEMGMGLKESMKDAIRDVVGDTKQLSDEQLAVMEEGFSKREDAMSKSFARQEKALSKSHSRQQDALSKKMDNDYKVVSKGYDNQLKRLEKSLSANYDAVSKSYDEQQKLLEKSLASEVKEFERASNEKIKVIDNEFKERLKLIDEEKYNQLKALDAQIDALDARTAAEDKVIKARENAERKAELNKAVREAKTVEDRQKAIKNLRDFEEKMRLEVIREDRKNQIDSIKEQKDNVKETSDAKKDALKSELDNQKEQLKEQKDAEKEALTERQNAQKESLQKQKQEELKALSESNKVQIDAMREVNQAKLASLKEEQSDRKRAISERLNDEMDAVRESHQAELASFKKMNDEKMAIAKDPPDSAAVEALFSKLEGFGKAIAAGGEEGAKAFSEMAEWLETIEDATLRETIGVELFGVMYEDQGEKITKVLNGVYVSQQEVTKGNKDIKDSAKDLETDPLTQLRQAFTDIKEALDPLLKVVSSVISAFAKFAKENPVLVSTITAIVAVLAIVGGAVVALTPIIGGLITVWGAVGTVFTVVSGVAAAAVGAISAPVLAIVAVVAGAVFLIIKYWDEIWEFTKKIFTQIFNFLKDIWDKIVKSISKAVESTVKVVKDSWDKIKKFTDFSALWKKTKDTWDNIADAIMKPINKAKEAVKNAIEAIKGFFKFDFNWPKLKVPKFKIKGSINPLDWFGEGLPSIDIQWHAKGGVFDKPTLFNTGSGMHGVGEAGPEAIIPLNARVLGAIGKGIYDASGGGNQPVIQNNFSRMMEGASFVIREESDIGKVSKEVARELYTMQQRDKKGR